MKEIWDIALLANNSKLEDNLRLIWDCREFGFDKIGIRGKVIELRWIFLQ
jgi:hypothetical protein